MDQPIKTERHRIHSTTDQLELVDTLIERIAVEMGFDDEARADLGICVTEAVNNAIVHGHKERADKLVDLHFERFPHALRVIVRDYGEGYDPDALPDPTLPENVMKLSGRGIHVIRSLMDDLKIERLEDGMRLTMVKLLS